MYKLYFGSTLKDKELRGIYNTQKEADAAMIKELEDKDIDCYYYRCWEVVKGITQIDYGNWNTFYFISKEGES